MKEKLFQKSHQFEGSLDMEFVTLGAQNYSRKKVERIEQLQR